MKRLVTIILALALIVRVIFILMAHMPKYTENYAELYPSLKRMYGESQYMSKTWKYWLPDETVYGYAAGAYVRGANPILVEPTQPPLGKYIIGLSIWLFNNQHMTVALFFVFVVAGTGILTLLLTGNMPVALAVSIATAFEPLIVSQLTYSPLLDIFFMAFVLYGVICTALAMRTGSSVFAALGVFLTVLSMVIKVWLIGLVFLIAVVLTIAVYRKRMLKAVAVGMILGGVGVVLSYTATIAGGKSIIDVLRIQKWLLWYQGGKVNRMFTIWPLIYLNRWYVWWGESEVIKDMSWSVTWPVILTASYVTLIASWKKLFTENRTLLMIALVILGYSIFMSAGQASARYLLPLLPFSYVITGYGVHLVLARRRKTR